jgi:hypothetical protein
MSDKDKTFYYLHELSDCKVADYYCDVRGWEVKDADNQTIGKVDRLLVNKETECVVYLEVDMDKSIIEDEYEIYNAPANKGVLKFLDKDADDHIYIPIEMTTSDEANKTVVCKEINYKKFNKTRRLSRGTKIEREFELNLFRAHVPDNEISNGTKESDKFY